MHERSPSAAMRVSSPLEHRGKLREQQHLMPAGGRFVQQFHAGIQLGAAAGVILPAKRRIAAELPQPCQHREHGDMTAAEAALQQRHAALIPGVSERTAVQCLLLLIQRTAHDALGFRR